MTEAAVAETFLGVERSIGGRRWINRLGHDRQARAISQALELPEIVGRVLAARGVTLDTAADYLNPTLRRSMPDPSRLRDMEVAAARLHRALERGEPIAIFGDYDVDGATSSALLRLYLEAVGAKVLVHIPDRMREGYGPNVPALADLAGLGARVVVTVDCGTTAFDALAEAEALGLDMIVVDHHLAGPRRPRCTALVNPNRLDDDSGMGALAAVGVTFLLLVALNRRLRAAGCFTAAAEPDLRAWLDLVALGTVCDVVPLVGLNRALVAQGLKVMARRGNPGLCALADVAGLDSPPGTYHLGFVLGPRVNAGGRVGRATAGHQLLTTADPGEAAALAQELDRYNRERQAIESEVLAVAFGQVAEQVDADGAVPGPLVMAAGEGWHPGVIGLVASRLADRHDRPSLVVAFDGALGKGSARSVPGVDIGAAVTAAAQAGLLVNGGGHRMAAGLTVARDRLGELRDFMTERLRTARRQDARPRLAFDGAITPSAANAELLDRLNAAGPYGSGNPEPRFAVAAARIVRAVVVGDGHVRCILAGSQGGRLKAIAFRAAGAPVGEALLAAGTPVLHVAGHLRPDLWQGRTGVQLVIDDVAAAR